MARILFQFRPYLIIVDSTDAIAKREKEREREREGEEGEGWIGGLCKRSKIVRRLSTASPFRESHFP